MSFTLLKGMQAYYQKSGYSGVWFYLRMRFYNRFIKGLVFADWHYFIDAERVLTKRYEQEIPLIDNSFRQYGNYYLCDDCPLDEHSVIYSLGVLSDTAFDQALVERLNCPVYLFDPSIIATRHINKLQQPKFVFTEVAIWNAAGDMHFTTPLYGGSPSMVLTHSGRTFTAKAITLPEAMQLHGHKHLDVIKLDVEGAAPAIINHMLDNKIYPSQIVAEFERPKTGKAGDFFAFYSELQTLRQRLSSLGYQVWRLPRDKYRYFSLELIFVRII